jgi:CdiI immunity protein
MMKMKLDNLQYFLSAYLHQDWPDEYASSAEALDSFCKNESAGRVSGLQADIEMLTKSNLDNEGVAATLTELGSFFEPSGEKSSPRQWLGEMAAQLAEGKPMH